MLFDSTGKWIMPAGVVRTFDWSPLVDSEALPSWLTLQGTSPIMTVNGIDGDRGYARFQTKSATPTAGDEAGVRVTAGNIDSAKFREIGFFVYGWACDSNTPTNVNMLLQYGDTSTGMALNANHSNSLTQFNIRPSVFNALPWELVANNNGTRRKNVGFVVRPATREVFITTGDPAEGAGIIGYHKGSWLNTVLPLICVVRTQSAAQRYMEFSRIKLRLVST